MSNNKLNEGKERTTKRLSGDRDMRNLIKRAMLQGWHVEKRNNNHLKWTAPSGFVYYSSSTPSDFRAIRKIMSALRREGLNL